MNRTGVFISVAVLLTAQWAWADCGGIPFKPGAVIFEPNQRAVIGYNGQEEILLLSTDFSVLLRGRACMLRIWEVKGRLSGFKKDIVTSAER